MLYCIGADITYAVDVVCCVSTGSYFISNCKCAVGVAYEVDSNNSTAGNEELVGIDANLSIVKSSGCCLITKVAVSHKPVEVVPCLDTDEAILCKENCDLAVYKLVDTDILVIVLTSIGQAVDITEKVVIGFF